MTTPDLVAFLTARLDEDEAYARQIIDAPDCGYQAKWRLPSSAVVSVGDEADWDLLAGDSRLAAHIARWDPNRVLAEVAAKRAIVDRYMAIVEDPQDAAGSSPTSWHYAGRRDELADVLLALARPYANHPDFDPEWNQE